MAGHTKKSKAKKVSRKIRILRKEGRPQKQAVAIALSLSRRKKKKGKR